MNIGSLAAGLPLLGWAGCYRLARELAARGRLDPDRREAFISGTALWGALLWAVTELSSVFRSLNRPTLVLAWAAADIALWATWAHLARARNRPAGAGWRDFLAECRSRFSAARSWPVDLRLMLLATVLLAAFLGAVAVLTPTTNWDSMTYHLPRVMHWIQNGTVAHYRTGSIGQLQMGPWSAFVQTHLVLLWGNDRFANTVQWFAMAGCLVTGSLIAARLAGPEVRGHRLLRVQVLTALLTVTLPTGLVESISTQTDYVVAFWVSCAAFSLLALRRDPSNMWHLISAGLTTGLALQTKITTVFYLSPLALAAAPGLMWKWRTPVGIAVRTALYLGLAGLLILPHSLRNRQVYGTPVGAPSTREGGMNRPISLSGTMSNMIRNLALHTDTGIRPLTRALNRVLAALHSLTGRGLSDPETTVYRDSFSFKEDFKIEDSTTGNPFHVALILAAAAAAAASPGRSREILFYGVRLAAGVVLFCVILKWQPWHSRYHLPFFVLFMPMVGAALASRAGAPLTGGLTAGLVLAAGTVIAADESRPLFNPAYLAQSRLGKMVFLQGGLFREHLEAMARDVMTSGCRNVAVYLHSDDAEYPLWVALRDAGFRGRIDPAYVDNETAVLPDLAPPGCVLLAMARDAVPDEARARFPYRLTYGVLSACFSSAAAGWSELEQFDTETQGSRRLTAAAAEFTFRHRLIKFYLRTPRPGRLLLTGTVTDAGGAALTNELRVSTYSGFEQTRRIDGRTVQLAIPSPGGNCAISLALMNPGSATNRADGPRLRLQYWGWKPD